MGQLRKQITQAQHEAFHRWLESSLALLTIMVLQRYSCLYILVILIPLYLLYYVPPTLMRLLYRMVFRERFALFRFGRIGSRHDKVRAEADILYREVNLNDNNNRFYI